MATSKNQQALIDAEIRRKAQNNIPLTNKGITANANKYGSYLSNQQNTAGQSFNAVNTGSKNLQLGLAKGNAVVNKGLYTGGQPQITQFSNPVGGGGAPVSGSPVGASSGGSVGGFNYGDNIANYDPNNAVHKQLADAGLAWHQAKARGDIAGMKQAEAIGQAIRAKDGLNQSAFNNRMGVSTFTPNEPNMDSIIASLKTSTQSSVDAGVAAINQTRDAQIAALQKQLNDAVASGEMSVREAQGAFEAQSTQINQASYDQKEVTDLSAQEMGVQNSQQYMGMQAGDNARKNQLVNQNMTTRDKAIADIKTRLQQIRSNTEIDTANINATAGYQSAQLTGTANAQMAGKMAELQGQDYFTKQGFQHDEDMSSLENAHTKENMAIQQKFNEKSMAIQQGYNEKNMGIQFKYELKKMAQGQVYDMAKMKQGFRYDMQKIAQQHTNDKEMLTERAKAAADDFETEMAQRERIYKWELSKEEAKHEPGSPEWKVKKKQMAEAHELEMSGMYTKAVFDSSVKAILEDENGLVAPTKPKNFDKLALNDPKRKSYTDKLAAYQRRQNFLTGTSNPDNLFQVDMSSAMPKNIPYSLGSPDMQKYMENGQNNKGQITWTSGLTD